MVLGQHLREERRDAVVAGCLCELTDQERAEAATLDAIADADTDLRARVVDAEVLCAADHRSLIPAREREQRLEVRWIHVDGPAGDLLDVVNGRSEAHSPAHRRQRTTLR